MKYIALILLLILACGSVSCSRNAGPSATAASAAQPPEVRVVKAEKGRTESIVAITGSLLSTVQVDVKTEQAGRLVEAPPREGETVERGQVIARLDDSNYRLNEEQARAAVAVAEAALERAGAAVQYSDHEMERSRLVQSSGGITQKDFQSAEFAARDARAQSQLAQAQLEQARQALALAEKRRRDCTILAPISGEVQTHTQNAGIYLDSKETLVRLVDNSRMELEVTVPSSELGRARAGQLARFTVDSFPGETFAATVLKLAPALQEQTRSVKVRLAVSNPARRLKAGMFVRGAIVAGIRDDALLLPAAAITRADSDPASGTVLVVEDGKIRRRAVRLGAEQDGKIEILRGIAAADLAVADPQTAPAEGERVRVRN
jgi:RND family efflux transporter MFP subunit